MRNTITRRVLVAVAVFTFILSALCITAFADNIKYDFTGYGNAENAAYNPENADAGGWVVEAADTEKGSADLYFYTTVKSVGVTDSISKHEGITNGISLIYNIPKDQQVKIKNYGAITFTRTLLNGTQIANMWGATYSVTLVTDDGQTVTRHYPWFDSSKGLRPMLATVTDDTLWSDIQALEGDPTLVQIKYNPYSSHPETFYMASSDYYKENEDGSVATAGMTLQFVTQYIQLDEVAALPRHLEGVKDNWDGKTVTEHDGKIINLNPNKTYSYAPVHSVSDDFITVTNTEEITELEGGVYEVYCSEVDKLPSEKIIIIVPKTTQGSLDFYKNWVSATNGGKYIQSSTPVSGYWSSGEKVPSPSGTATLNISYRRNAANGGYYNYSANVGLGDAAGEYFRRNVVAYTYALPLEQQFDVDKLAIFSSQSNSQYLWQNTPISQGKASFAILVYTNGDMDNPAIFEFPWTTNLAEVNVNASSELDGYVTAIKYVHYYNIPDEDVYSAAETTSAYVVYNGVKTYELEESSFVLPDLAPVTENEYKFIGLDVENSYRISKDMKTWTKYVGVSEISGIVKGTYYIQALGNDTEAASKIYTLEIAGAQETVTGLAYENGCIIGLDSDKSYEYSKVSIDPFVWTDVADGAEQITDITDGVWAVRLKGDSTHVSGAPQYVIARGANYGSINWGNIDAESKGFVKGAWTTGEGESGYTQLLKDNNFAGGEMRFRYVQNWKTVYENRMNHSWSYALKDDEVFPVANLLAFPFSIGYGAKWPWETDATLTARFRIYIAGGDVAYYDIDVDYKNGGSTFDPSTVIPADAKGFVTAITIWPVYSANPSTILIAGNNYPTFKLPSYCPEGNESLEDTDVEKWRVNLFGMPAPVGLELERPLTTGYVNGGWIISGLDTSKGYEYSVDGGEYVAVEKGSEYIICEAPGDYNVRIAATELDEASSFVSFVVPMVNPVFGDRSISEYVYTKTQTFRTGQWSTWPGNWDKTDNPTSNINTTVPLNTVSYKYEFLERDYFKVDDNPYFSIDYNYQLMNMTGVSFEGETFTVDIYVVGEDKPYTITSVYKGYARVDGYTPNKMTVNLLDEYPALEGKYVRAFDIRPFVENENTPSDYNTESEKDRYMYFRLFYVGFFDTPANTDAVALSTNERVNYYTGIRAETDVIYTIGAEAKASDFNVYELYSDGTEREIETFSVSTTDDFAAESGNYDVTLTSRLGKTTVVEVVSGLDSISIKNAPQKTSYYEGDKLDLKGLELVAILEDGSEILISKGYSVSADIVSPDMTFVTISFGGLEASYPINVTPLIVESVAINTLPDKEVSGEYVEGQTVDLTGLTIKVVYNNGVEEILGLDKIEAVYGADVMTRGTPLTINFAGKTISVILTVNSKVISGVSIASLPEKLVYILGQELDFTGLTVNVAYEDGTEMIASEGFITNSTLDEAGTVTVEVLYEGFAITFDVEVVLVETAFIMEFPTKLEYQVGEEFNAEGLVLYVLFSNGEELLLTEGFELIYDEFTAEGEYEVVLKYFDFEESFVVTVVGEEEPEPEVPENIAEGTIEGTTVNWVITTDGTLTVSGAGEVPNYTRSATAPWYAYAKQIKKIVVADGITKLGDYCFYNLSKATAIEISTTVKFLGVQFIRQTAITEVTLTSDVTITANAFGRADSLTTLNLSEDVKNLQGNIFYQETVTIKAPENSFAHKYAEIYASKFASSAATVAYESDGTTAKLPIVRFAAAGDNAFFAIYENAKGNWALEVSGIGVMKNFPYVSPKNIAKGYTFSPMYYIADEEAKIDGVEPEAKIASITVKEGITTVGNYIFYKCTKATTLTLPEGITSIGQGAFRLCQRIAKITLPEAVTKIEKNAFLSCGKLVEIYIPEGVTTVGEGIFEKCDSINSLVVKTKSAAAIEVISAEYPQVTIVSDF